MKFSCSAENLYSGLSAVSRALSSKGSLPVLSYVLLTANKDSLFLSATNLELSVTTAIPAKVSEEGSVCAPGRLLTDLISSVDSSDVEVVEKDNILAVQSLNVKSKLNGIGATEFPKLPSASLNENLSLNPSEFSKALPSVIFSAAADESRPVLTGVLFELNEESLILVGVDGFRLSEKRIKISGGNPFKVVVPARPLGEVARLIGGEESIKVYLDSEESQIIFKTPRYEIACRLIEGSFPDYKKIIPESFVALATVSTEEFRKSAKLASLFAKDSSNVIKISLIPNESVIVLSANTPEIGENETRFSAKIEGEALNVAFNNKYLSDCLNNIDTPELIFQASGQLNPGRFSPVGDESFLHIIMPVRVQE